jgi:hypothetical protein
MDLVATSSLKWEWHGGLMGLDLSKKNSAVEPKNSGGLMEIPIV